MTTPMSGIRSACSARAMRSHMAGAPTKNAMNSRRLMHNHQGRDLYTLTQVLRTWLRMPALGQSRHIERAPATSALVPISRHMVAAQYLSKRASFGLMHRSKLGFYSITLSARARSVLGISIPNTFAVCRLMTNSNLLARRTGRVAGFSPLSTRPV